MTELRPCPECNRHVNVEDAVCPFCASELALSAAPARRPAGRITRAAVFATALAGGTAAAACGSTQNPADNANNNTAPPMVADAGAMDEEPPPAPDAAPVATPPDDKNIDYDRQEPMPYGAPPVRKRLV